MPKVAENSELWYVRLPDGRVIRAKTTRALRYHLRSGRIPWSSLVRRDPAEDWVSLDWTPEFADLARERRFPRAAANAAAPARPAADHPVVPQSFGVRRLFAELVNALESSFNPVRLFIAAGMGLVLALTLVGQHLFATFLEPPLDLALTLGCALALGALFVLGSVVITRMTVLELARMRPARPRDVRAGLLPRTLRVFFCQVLVAAVVLGVLWALLWMSTRPNGQPLPEWLSGPLAAARLIMEVICFPVLGLSCLLVPLMIVEETGVFGTLRHWWRLLRAHLGRLLVYEALVLAIGFVIALPFLAPVVFAASLDPGVGVAALVRSNLLLVFAGFALTPFLSFFVTANVNIYLNVQYDFFQSQRQARARR